VVTQSSQTDARPSTEKTFQQAWGVKKKKGDRRAFRGEGGDQHVTVSQEGVPVNPAVSFCGDRFGSNVCAAWTVSQESQGSLGP